MRSKPSYLSWVEYDALQSFLVRVAPKRGPKDLAETANRFTPEGLARIQAAIRKIDEAIQTELSETGDN